MVGSATASTQKPDLTSWALLVTCAFIWGGSFILMKKGLTAFSAPQVAALRIFFAMLVFIPFMPRAFKDLKPGQLRTIWTVGFFGNALPPFLFTAAQTHINSATAGILNALSPIFTLIIGLIAFGMVFNVQKLMGVLVGFLGAFSLIIHTAQGNSASDYSYGLLVVLATVCYGISINMVKARCQDISPITINAISFASWGLWVTIYLFSGDFVHRCQTEPNAQVAIMSLITLSLFGTALASIIYYYLAQRTDALFSSMTTYLMPVFSIAWGVWDGESVDMVYFLGILFIFAGIYLTQRK